MFRALVTPSVVASSIGGVAFCGSESPPGPRESEVEARIASSLAERLELSAEASLLEEDLDVNVTEQHLRLMLPGVLS